MDTIPSDAIENEHTQFPESKSFCRMLSKETLEQYRRMTPSQRLALTIQSMEGIDRALLSGTEEQVDRKFELLRRENDLRNRNMLTAIAKSRGNR